MSDNRHNQARLASKNGIRSERGERDSALSRSVRVARERPELELGLLQMQILWMLKEPRHGYALMKALNEVKNTKVTQGTLYPALQRLEELGLVKRKQVGRKYVWKMTPSGKRTMLRSCEDFCRTFHGIIRDFVCEKCH